MTALAPAEDASPADWLVESLTTFAESVLSLVPAGFDAHVRVFHRGRHGGRPLRWAEIAAEHGRVAHAGMQLGAIDLRYEQLIDGEVYDHAPEEGSLPRDDAEIVARVLASHTTTPEKCWFALWTGWASHSDLARTAPTFEVYAIDPATGSIRRRRTTSRALPAAPARRRRRPRRRSGTAGSCRGSSRAARRPGSRA